MSKYLVEYTWGEWYVVDRATKTPVSAGYKSCAAAKAHQAKLEAMLIVEETGITIGGSHV